MVPCNMRRSLAAAALVIAASGCGSSPSTSGGSPSTSGGSPSTGCSAFCEQAGPEQGGLAIESCTSRRYPCQMLSLLTSSAAVDGDGRFRIRVRCGWERDCSGAVVVLKYVTNQGENEAFHACAKRPATQRQACVDAWFRLGGSDFTARRRSTASITVALNTQGSQALGRTGVLRPDISAHIKGDQGKDVVVTDFRPRASAGTPQPFTLTARG